MSEADDISYETESTEVGSASFKDFFLREELLQSIRDNGFEQPSEVQRLCIPQALLGTDVIGQAKSGMGKTAVYVLAILHQLVPEDKTVSAVVVVHSRELASQVANEFRRFSKHLPYIRVESFFGGIPREDNVAILKSEYPPNIVVGCPGRLMDLSESGDLKLDKVKYFVVDECDSVLKDMDMRATLQKVFFKTPRDKQVMMFTATLPETMLDTMRKFMKPDVHILRVENSKLTLNGLIQYYVDVDEKDKIAKLLNYLDTLEFNQVVIFVNTVVRARDLSRLLSESKFPVVCIHGSMKQVDRLQHFKEFRETKHRILVATDVMARGIDVERVNVVINYDFPQPRTETDTTIQHAPNTYLNRVGRAGRFGTKGLSLSFLSSEEDHTIFEQVQKRFSVQIPPAPETIDVATYMNTTV